MQQGSCTLRSPVFMDSQKRAYYLVMIILLIFSLLMLLALSCGNVPDTAETENESVKKEGLPAGQQSPPGGEKPPAEEEYSLPEGPVSDNDEHQDAAGEEPVDILEDPPAREKNELLPEVLALKPHELGEVMILMYHEIGEPEGEWRRTPDNFRRDLKTLYEKGYRAVSMTDYVRGNIAIPAGTSPVVLTFDDGNRGNFNYLFENGEPVIDPDCAVAILEDFYAEHPEFGLEATFYIYYPNPFRQPEYIEKKLNYLLERGFEIGNHTYSHANLSRLNRTEVQQELALHVQSTREYLPGYEVNSLALTYGAYPREPELALRGSYAGTSYEHEAVLLVGANPAPSPFHKNFNPARLPRIRASEMKTEGVGLYDWLQVMEKNPDRRYISDGNPDTITAPAALQEHLQEELANDYVLHFYDRRPE